ncbi:MAG: DUF4419 domain-containing protein [Treponema sp.]|jgi:hypothetical protein|nr:DUF4419 domain-containing protein [Treponema sp.]
MKTKKAVTARPVLLSLPLILFTLSFCSSSKPNDRLQFPQTGITFQVVEELSRPEGPLAMQSGNDVLEHLVKLSQKKDKEYPSDIFAKSRLPAEMVNYGYHSFFDGIYYAYLEHRPIVLSPDAVWLLISQGFAQHVNANAEKLRHYFVNFDGKLTLTVMTSAVTLDNPDSPWETIFPQFTQQIAEHTGEELINLLSADFTTTTIVEKVASEITIMESMKAYFEYAVMYVLCGIPEVTLLGTTEDWQKILDRTKRLGRYELTWWTDELEPVLAEFVNASRGNISKEFWMNMFDKEYYSLGCGSATIINGWITKFFPCGSNGERNSLRSIKSSGDLPEEIVKVDLLYYDTTTGISTPLELWAGFFGLDQNTENFALTPKIGWMIKKADPENSELAKKLESGGFYSIHIRVMEFPEVLLHVNGISTLTIDFINEITIPDAFAGVKIGYLNLSGKIEREEIERIIGMFPDSQITINGETVNGKK